MDKATLIADIKEMKSVIDDSSTPQETKDVLTAAVKEAEGKLKEIEDKEKQIVVSEKKLEQEVAKKERVVNNLKKPAKKEPAPVVEKRKKAAEISLATSKKKLQSVKEKHKKEKKHIETAIQHATKKTSGILSTVTKNIRSFNKGRSEGDLNRDAHRRAKSAGKRVTEWGTVYYENRANRSDISRRKMPWLESGGEIVPANARVLLFANKKSYEVGDHVAYKDPSGEFTLAGTITRRMKDNDGIGMYSVNDEAMYTADELRPLMYEENDHFVDEDGNRVEDFFVTQSNKVEYKFGGRLKSALMRDRAYKSNEPHEQAYKRKTSPKNPKYKYDDGGLVLREVPSGIDVGPFLPYYEEQGYNITTKVGEDGSTKIIGVKGLSEMNPMGKMGENIMVYGYQTKNFDICPTAAQEFNKAMAILNADEMNEGMLWRNRTSALESTAKYADEILGFRKIHAGIETEFDFQILAKNIMFFGMYNYKNGALIQPDFIAYHVGMIFTEATEYENTARVSHVMARGGMIVGRWYKRKNGEQVKFMGDKDADTGVFQDINRKYINLPHDEIEVKGEKSKLFGIFEEGGPLSDKVAQLMSFAYPVVKSIAKEHGLFITPNYNISDGGTTKFVGEIMWQHEDNDRLHSVGFSYLDSEENKIGEIILDAENEKVKFDFPEWNIVAEADLKEIPNAKKLLLGDILGNPNNPEWQVGGDMFAGGGKIVNMKNDEAREEAIKKAVEIAEIAGKNNISASENTLEKFSEKIFDASHISFGKPYLFLAYNAMKNKGYAGGGQVDFSKMTDEDILELANTITYYDRMDEELPEITDVELAKKIIKEQQEDVAAITNDAFAGGGSVKKKSDDKRFYVFLSTEITGENYDFHDFSTNDYDKAIAYAKQKSKQSHPSKPKGFEFSDYDYAATVFDNVSQKVVADFYNGKPNYVEVPDKVFDKKYYKPAESKKLLFGEREVGQYYSEKTGATDDLMKVVAANNPTADMKQVKDFISNDILSNQLSPDEREVEFAHHLADKNYIPKKSITYQEGLQKLKSSSAGKSFPTQKAMQEALKLWFKKPVSGIEIKDVHYASGGGIGLDEKIGETRSGKPIYHDFENTAHENFTKEDHRDAANFHGHIHANIYHKKKVSGISDEEDKYWREGVDSSIKHVRSMYPEKVNTSDLHFSDKQKESATHVKKYLQKKARLNKKADGGSVNKRIDEMVEHWEKYGWAGSRLGENDNEFFERIGVSSDNVGITSFTGNDIKYYDDDRVVTTTGGFRPKNLKGFKVHYVKIYDGKQLGDTVHRMTIYDESESDAIEKFKKMYPSYKIEYVSPEFAGGGSASSSLQMDPKKMKYALLNHVSSGTIASHTGITNYKDIDGIRITAVSMLNRDGDISYSIGALKKLLLEAKDEYFENKNAYSYASGGNVTNKFMSDAKGNYMLLSRMQSDVLYYIAHPHEKHLWSGSVKQHVADMRELYKLLPKKPEWISLKDIDEYEKQMKKVSEAKNTVMLEVDGQPTTLDEFIEINVNDPDVYSISEDDLKAVKSLKVGEEIPVGMVMVKRLPDEKSMGKGGSTFSGKVKAISKNLTGKNVPPKYQPEYGKKYSKKEATAAATKIAGSIVKKERKK